jgi:hypothetical protein
MQRPFTITEIQIQLELNVDHSRFQRISSNTFAIIHCNVKFTLHIGLLRMIVYDSSYFVLLCVEEEASIRLKSYSIHWKLEELPGRIAYAHNDYKIKAQNHHRFSSEVELTLLASLFGQCWDCR